jgi:hypothetical protein
MCATVRGIHSIIFWRRLDKIELKYTAWMAPVACAQGMLAMFACVDKKTLFRVLYTSKNRETSFCFLR